MDARGIIVPDNSRDKNWNIKEGEQTMSDERKNNISEKEKEDILEIYKQDLRVKRYSSKDTV